MSQRSRPYRVGVDIGGTFVDVAVQDVRDGSISVGKRLSDPADPARSALAAIDEVLRRAGSTLGEVDQVVHATTIGPNTIIQRRGAKSALLITEGFGDLLILQRQVRHSPYDLAYRRYEPLVPRERVFEVPERMRADGEIHRPLDEDAVTVIAKRLLTDGATAVGVCLLHSYVDARHERRIAELLAEHAPGLAISLSSEVAPRVREYERASTTVANAYIQGAFRDYLTSMQRSLTERGFDGGFYIMQANGGLATVEQITRTPIHALESGPAAGAIMAAEHGVRTGAGNVLSFDMGGTTAKAAAAIAGDVGLVSTFEVDRTLMRPGTGIPVMIPSLDLVEIGAGGGSIARTELGIVAVGPQSAGAQPGPACYGKGGQAPTVTDANLALGYLDPDYFNGGDMPLDRAATAEAITRDIGTPLGLDTQPAAWGICEAVTENMADAIRAVSLERGYDPREFALVAFGGSGPLHAARIARALRVPKVLIPQSAGVMSAVGLLAADARFDLSRTLVTTADAAGTLDDIDSVIADLRVEAEEQLAATRLSGERRYLPSVEMRYQGQGHEIEVPLPGAGEGDRLAALLDAFAKRYAQLFGYGDSGAPVEITGIRLTAQVAVPGFHLPEADASRSATPDPDGHRDAYFPEAGGVVSCAVYRRERLSPGDTIAGPAIVEEKESTTVALPGDRVSVDARHNVVIEIGAHTHD